MADHNTAFSQLLKLVSRLDFNVFQLVIIHAIEEEKATWKRRTAGSSSQDHQEPPSGSDGGLSDQAPRAPNSSCSI